MLSHINYKMPIYKDCTLQEVMMVGCFVLLTTVVGLSILTKFLFGYSAIGAALSLALTVPLTRLILSRLQKIKIGKPYGYYQQLFIKKLSEMGLMKTFYITRKGRWSTRRYMS